MIEYFRLDIRKYAPRWGYVAGLLFELAVMITWVCRGRMPVTTYVRLTPNSYRQLPFEVSRLVDGVVIVLPVAFLAYLVFTSETRLRHWTRHDDEKHDVSRPFGWGAALGVCGGLLIVCTGFSGLLIGTAISVVVISLLSIRIVHYYQAVMCCAVATLVVWFMTMPFVGAVAATVYAVSTAVVAVVVPAAIFIAVALVATLAAACWTIIEYVFYNFLVPKQHKPDVDSFFSYYWKLVRALYESNRFLVTIKEDRRAAKPLEEAA